MEDIASGDGNLDVEDVLFGFGRRGKDGHSLEKGADFLREEGETCTGVDVRDFGGHFAGCDIGAETTASVVLRVNCHRLNTDLSQWLYLGPVREGFRAIDREHGYHDIDDNIQLRLVCSSTFNEDILCIHRDFSEIAVDNRRQ